MVRSEPGSEQEKSAAVQIRQGQQRNINRMQDRYRARTNTTPRQSLWVWP
ncbi:unnamed protein product, partial [Staurois parvus]